VVNKVVIDNVVAIPSGLAKALDNIYTKGAGFGVRKYLSVC
jgi:hypothetical protein